MIFCIIEYISAEYSYSDASESRLKSKDGYYTFKKPGKYLIELWGGDGGRAFLTGRSGVGGQGGWVYGVLNVGNDEIESGDNPKKLVYEIGSKGESKTFDVSGGGGSNTNCVIAVHRGLGGSVFLRYVEKLETGDIVRIENFWYTLEYKVTGIKIIEPDDVKPILIKNGKDMLTLYTCHPYGVNSQRYLVYCERITK